MEANGATIGEALANLDLVTAGEALKDTLK
jgi:hypothetical protein